MSTLLRANVGKNFEAQVSWAAWYTLLEMSINAARLGLLLVFYDYAALGAHIGSYSILVLQGLTYYWVFEKVFFVDMRANNSEIQLKESILLSILLILGHALFVVLLDLSITIDILIVIILLTCLRFSSVVLSTVYRLRQHVDLLAKIEAQTSVILLASTVFSCIFFDLKVAFWLPLLLHAFIHTIVLAVRAPQSLRKASVPKKQTKIKFLRPWLLGLQSQVITNAFGFSTNLIIIALNFAGTPSQVTTSAIIFFLVSKINQVLTFRMRSVFPIEVGIPLANRRKYSINYISCIAISIAFILGLIVFLALKLLLGFHLDQFFYIYIFCFSFIILGSFTLDLTTSNKLSGNNSNILAPMLLIAPCVVAPFCFLTIGFSYEGALMSSTIVNMVGYVFYFVLQSKSEHPI